MKNNKGIALTTVLLFLVILSLLSIAMLEAGWLATRKSRNQWQKQKIDEAAEAGLAVAEQSLKQQLPHCMIPVTPAYELQTKPMTWWASTASCAGNFQSVPYYFVVEYLTTDPCLQSAKTNMGGDYFRITVLATQAGIRTLLQSTWINQSSRVVQCKATVRELPMGRQAWRQLA